MNNFNFSRLFLQNDLPKILEKLSPSDSQSLMHFIYKLYDAIQQTITEDQQQINSLTKTVEDFQLANQELQQSHRDLILEFTTKLEECQNNAGAQFHQEEILYDIPSPRPRNYVKTPTSQRSRRRGSFD